MIAPLLPMIPDNAPFTSQQRAWLNGFFAAVLSARPQTDGGANLVASAANSVAVAPVEEAAEDFPWHDPTLPIADRLQLAAGKPLPQRLMAAMAQLNCGACGYLCQSYSAAIACGEEQDITRCSPGGSDTAKALKQILAEPPAAPATETAAKAIGSNGHARSNGAASANGKATLAAAPKYTRNQPFTAKLLHSTRLTHLDAPKDTRHVVINLAGSGLTYEPGDSLGILPVNCPDLVAEVVRLLGAPGETVLEAGPAAGRSLTDVLSNDFTLARSRPELFELLSRHAKTADDRAALESLGRQETNELLSADIAEVLGRFPSARPPLDEFVATLAKLQPRLYSISSSLRAHPNEVHLTVGVVRYESCGRWRNGVASHFLGVRSLPGDEVRVFVQPSRFRLPSDPSAPIIMVGPGTGIAPFRAFLEERQALGSRSPAWLLFGNQYFEYDFLYRDELAKFLDSGALGRLDLAFSRDQAEKLYVQHKMLENGEQMYRWLEEGAHFYVCGDAKRMASDVDGALQQIVARHGGLTADKAKEYVSNLSRAKRYHKDVY